MSLQVDIRAVAGRFELAISLDVAPGETVAVIGPNGAGKTTLLRALAGLAPGVTGTIRLDGDAWLDAHASVPANDRSVGMVFAGGALFPTMSALDNVAFPLQARGMRRRVARPAAQEWLERMGVASVGGARPGQLSSGQARRVALARALAARPRLLLLDEPLTSLDLSTLTEVRRVLAEHLGGFEGVAVVVSHDPVDASVLGDRLAVLEEGRLVQVGTATEVTARPRSRYAARWVGVNLFRGRAAGGVVALDEGGELSVADAPDGTVFAAVHPASVALHARRPEGTPRNTWPATVDGIDDAGSRRRVRLSGPVALVAEVTGAGSDAIELVPGASVWVAIKATEIEVYPA